MNFLANSPAPSTLPFHRRLAASCAIIAGLAATIAATLPSVASAADSSKLPDQLVISSFDGAHDNRLWDRSLKLAARSGARFIYFLSCTFLTEKAEARRYKAPGHTAGRSNVGFAKDKAEVLTRLDHVWSAYRAGHEIGSHGCGHFDGKGWSEAQWQSEFNQFDDALLNAWANNGGNAPAGWNNFTKSAIKGFRAPYLSTGKEMFAALEKHGFAYDASSVSLGPAMPDFSHLTARFALPLIAEGPKDRRIIAMDYNLFARHSDAIETPAKSAEFEERALSAFRTAFAAEYSGQRKPLQLGFHFVEMNGGAYWRALERFAKETCGRPDVACVTYQEAIRRLNGRNGSAS
jgi:peptidoglycan/xylan/chitin deacetylase (PgdA/CDA1 family)